VGKYGEYNTAHAHCMLDNLGHGNTLNICDIIYLPRHICDYAKETQLSDTRTLPVLLRNKGFLSSVYRRQHYDVFETEEQANIFYSVIHLSSTTYEHILRHKNVPAEATGTFRNVQGKLNFAQVGYGVLMGNYTCTQKKCS